MDREIDRACSWLSDPSPGNLSSRNWRARGGLERKDGWTDIDVDNLRLIDRYRRRRTCPSETGKGGGGLKRKDG